MLMRILLSFFLLTSLASAQSKKDISGMLDHLKEKGVFSEEQVQAAQEQLSEMNDQDIQKLIQDASKKMNDPKVQEKLRQLEK